MVEGTDNSINSRLFRWLVPFLEIGLSSYAGSHVSRFDLAAYGSPVDAFQLPNGHIFRQQSLSCLGDFIGGPAWVLESHGTRFPMDYLVSITIDDFVDLWGPVQAVDPVYGPDGFGGYILTERGRITLSAVSEGSQLIKDGEALCHWERIYQTLDGASDITSTERLNSDMLSNDELRVTNDSLVTTNTTVAIQGHFAFGKRLLIGIKDITPAGLQLKRSCQMDIQSHRRTRQASLNFPGVFKAHLDFDELAFTLGGGQFITPSVEIHWKRIPGRSLKELIMFYCRQDGSTFEKFLALKLGLEVSICTGNARRVSLWDALQMLYKYSPTHNGEADESTICPHFPGDFNCVRECWDIPDESFSKKSPGNPAVPTETDYRSLLRARTLDLSMTGVDKDNILQAWWPFHSTIYTRAVKTKEHDGTSNNWIPMLKDRREVATFAVMSRRCLEFSGNDSADATRIRRLCTFSKRGNPYRSGAKISRTVLETTIQLHGNSLEQFSAKEPFEPLKMLTCLRIGDVGTLEIRNEARVQLALFKSGLLATIKEFAICVSQAKWGSTHFELIDTERALDDTIDVVVI
jgi:hypothetical protein